MSEKNLVICDNEFYYANALAENILEREELHVKVHTFTSLEKAFLFSQERKIHIFLVDESMEGYEREVIDADLHFVLIHGGEVNLREKEKPIYKYQCANQIIREVFEAYVGKIDEKIFKTFRQSRTRLEAIYSPVRGIGKTRFAIALGREMAKKEKVLYLNLEEYPGFEPSGMDENPLNLGDLLYFAKQSEGNLGLRLQAAVQKMGDLDYIPPIFLAIDLKEVTAEEWVSFLDKIQTLGLYDSILLDMGESVQGLFQILGMCDKIHMPIKEDEAARQKVARYEQCLERLKLEKIIRMTQQFILPEHVESFVKMKMKEDD